MLRLIGINQLSESLGICKGTVDSSDNTTGEKDTYNRSSNQPDVEREVELNGALLTDLKELSSDRMVGIR